MKLRRNKIFLPIGLDIGSTALRAVQLYRQGDDLHLHAALALPHPHPDNQSSPDHSLPHSPLPPDPTNTHDENHILQTSAPTNLETPAPLVVQLQRLIQRGGFVGRKVVLHCPADKLDMRPIDLPAPPEGLPHAAVAGAVKIQIDQLPTPFPQTVCDYLNLGYDPHPGILRIMAVIADAQFIQQRIQLVKKTNLHCLHIDALPCNLSRLLQHTLPNTPSENSLNDKKQTSKNHHQQPPTPSEHLTAVIDIGLNGSTLVICNPAGPVFARQFPFAGRHITNTLAQRLLINLQKAEHIKEKHGIDWHTRHLCNTAGNTSASNTQNTTTALLESPPKNNPAQPELAKAIYAALQTELYDYALSLTRALNYVVANRAQAQLKRILLTGSAAHLKNLPDFLTHQFELPVQLLDHPLLHEITNALPRPQAIAGPWTTALGLALYQGDTAHGSR